MVAVSAQLFGNLPHHRLGQSAEWPKQPSAIDRAGLIDHHLADAPAIFSGNSTRRTFAPVSRVVQGSTHVQQARLDHDD
jgi:hypothetical protein